MLISEVLPSLPPLIIIISAVDLSQVREKGYVNLTEMGKQFPAVPTRAVAPDRDRLRGKNSTRDCI